MKATLLLVCGIGLMLVGCATQDGPPQGQQQPVDLTSVPPLAPPPAADGTF